MTAHGSRVLLRVILLLAGAAVLVITLWPTPVDRPVDSELGRVLALLHRHGVPGWVDYAFVERAANVVLFVPVGALVALELPQSLWWCSGAIGLTLSLCVEFCQYVFLPDRFASVGDLAMNTAGALVGGGCVALGRIAARQRSHRA